MWVLVLVLGYYGLGAGFVLAALHSAAMSHIAESKMGMAAGVLSGTVSRHPNATHSVAPIASGSDRAADVERSCVFQFLIDGGCAGSLVEAAIRFAISNLKVSTALLGISSLEQLEQAIAAARRSSLPGAALERIHKGRYRCDALEKVRCTSVQPPTLMCQYSYR